MLKLRELIKKVRSCKTAEEERSIMNKESAEIRNLGKDQTDIVKCRNLLKCVYMHMMGKYFLNKVIQQTLYMSIVLTCSPLIISTKSELLIYVSAFLWTNYQRYSYLQQIK
jgi:hypothetical protein